MTHFLSENILLTLVLTVTFTVDITKSTYTENNICADFIFILDESTGLLPGEFDLWKDGKQFMEQMTNDYTISQSQTRFGVIGYASSAVVQIDLEEARNQSELVKKIQNLQLLVSTGMGDGRNMTDGFLMAIDQISLKRRYGVPVYVILIATDTDNMNPESVVLEAASSLLDLNVQTYMLFETTSTTIYDQMRAIASATSGVLFQMVNEHATIMNYSYTFRDEFLTPAIIQASCVDFPCEAEVAFLIDKSNSISSDDYMQKVVPYLLSFISYLQPGKKVKLTLVDICDPSTTRIVFDFNSDQNIRNIKNKLQTRTCTNAETALETALNLTSSTIFSDSPQYHKARFVVIVTQRPATDAYNQSYIPAIDILINQKKADIYAIGIGPNIEADYLTMLTKGHEKHQLLAPGLLTPNLGQQLMANDLLNALITYCTNQPTTSLLTTSAIIPTSPTPDWAQYCIFPATSLPTSSVSRTTTWTSAPFLEVELDKGMDQNMTTMAYRNLTALLLLLSKEEITNSTADHVSETLESLLVDLGVVMNEEDIYLTALILYNISIVYPLSDRAFGAAVGSVNIILSQDEGTIRRSNFLYQATQYIQQFFSQATAHTTSDFIIHDATQYVFVSIQHVRCGPSSQKVVGAVQYEDGEVCISGPGPVPHNETDVIVYIQLPTDAFCDTLSTRQKRSATNNEFRVATVFYRNQKLFGKEDPAQKSSSCDLKSQPKSDYVATMDVMSIDHVHVGPMPIWGDIKQPVSFGMNTRNSSDYKKKLHAQESCSYWDNSLGWISNRCKKVQLIDEAQVQGCQCDHLTDFTLVVNMRESDPMLCDSGISIFSLIIEILSIIALFIAIILQLLKYYHTLLPGKLQNTSLIKYLQTWNQEEKSDGRKSKPVREMLMSTMLLFLFLFVLLSDQRTLNLSNSGCDASAAILYCILLSSFLWTAFAAINYYRLCVKVFYNRMLNILVSKKVTFPVACGVPILITVIIWAANKEFYSRDDGFCWIRPNEIYIIPAIIVPTTVFICLDIILTARVINNFRNMSGTRNVTVAMSASAERRVYIQYAMALVWLQFIMEIPWVAQYFTIGSTNVIAVHYIFVFFNGTQGFWMASLYIYAWISSLMEYRRKSKIGNPPCSAPREIINKTTDHPSPHRQKIALLPKKTFMK